MLRNDVDAIGSIVAQRGGYKYETLENCPAIFVTTNYSLVRESNSFLRYQAYRNWIAPSISDTDLVTILWLKYGFADSNMPRLMLVQHASAAIAPSDSVLDRFFEVTKNLEERGTFSPDEAAFMRYSIYARREITTLCSGDSASIDDTTVLAVRERVKKQYTEESIREKCELTEEVQNAKRAAESAHAEMQNAQINATNKINSANEGRNRAEQAAKDAKQELLKTVETTAISKAKRWTVVTVFILRGLLVAVTLFCGYLSFEYGKKLESV